MSEVRPSVLWLSLISYHSLLCLPGSQEFQGFASGITFMDRTSAHAEAAEQVMIGVGKMRRLSVGGDDVTWSVGWDSCFPARY